MRRSLLAARQRLPAPHAASASRQARPGTRARVDDCDATAGRRRRARSGSRNRRAGACPASGSWRARIAASRSAVMPGRASTRWRCRKARRADHRDRIDQALAAGLEQQRDVEHHERPARRRGSARESAARRAHQRMEDRLQARQRRRVAEHPPAERLPVDRAVARRSRGTPRRPAATAAPPGPSRRCTAASASNTGTPSARNIWRRGRLAHRDRAGEAEHDHRDQPPVAARTTARSSSSTAGSIPNQARKPGRAWCSSMPRPSTTGLPCARATASSGVISGV